MPLRLYTVWRIRLRVRDEGQDVGRGNEGGHAEKADEPGLDETRHDQRGDICHGGDTGDGEEDPLAWFRAGLPYCIQDRPTLYSSLRSSFSALSFAMSFSCSRC